MEKNIKKWHFQEDNDHLIELVLSGKKHAKISIYNNEKSSIGERYVLLFDNEKKACIIEIKNVIVAKFNTIDDEVFAFLEEDARDFYFNYFKELDKSFDQDSDVLIEIFEVVHNLVQERLEIALKICQGNKDIFGEEINVYEINAGFNNSIFSVNDRYVIKVCGEDENESLFDVESNFYNANSGCGYIPILYAYDKSKKIVPYVYEIIEKINGKSVYYYWYKMNEKEREDFIKNLVKVLKSIHLKSQDSFDWSKYVKDKVRCNFNETLDMFTNEERGIISDTIDMFDLILVDNRFCLIHNDLHFDNIFLDEKNDIKLIDFNDSFVAPFDYDLRLLYMSVSLPWKWANTEMDPFQNPRDYKNLFEYLKKYYDELRCIKHLEERMIVYSIMNDFSLLPRFKEDESKKRILDNCRRILKIFKK